MTDYELLRDSLLKIRLDYDLKSVDEDLEKNKPTVAEDGKKLNIFKKMGNSIKDSKTENLNKDKQAINDEIASFSSSHKEILTEEEIPAKIDALFADDTNGFKRNLFAVLATSNGGYKFVYEKEGFNKIEKLLGLSDGELNKKKEEILTSYRDLVKEGLLSTVEKLDDETYSKLENAIFEILNGEKNSFISKFVIESSAYKLDLVAKEFSYDSYTSKELALAYAIIIVLAKKHQYVDSLDDRKLLVSNLVKQENSLLADVNYAYLVSDFNSIENKTKYLVLHNFEQIIINNFCK